VSNLGRIRRVDTGNPSEITGSGSAPRLPMATEDRSGIVPSVSGTAILNLSDEQTTNIRQLLVALRRGQKAASDVRSQIFGLLSGGQRRVLDAAYFIISVRV